MKSGNQDALDLEFIMLAHMFRGLLNDIAPGCYPEPAEGSEPVEGCDDGRLLEEFSAVFGGVAPEKSPEVLHYELCHFLGGSPADSRDEWDYATARAIEDARAFVARAQGTLIEYP